jgi:hypothetical protein
MRNLKFTRLLPLVLGIILITMISSSCVDNNEPTPDYAGKWKTEKPYPSTNGYVKVFYYLELSNSEFTEIFVKPTLNATSTPTQVKIEGSVSATGNILILTPNKLSYSYYNSSTSTAAEPYENYSNKDQDFDLRLDGLILPSSNHKMEYSLTDGKLILKIDYNKDGVYSESETVYTKQ